jgi:UDP-N-acetylglucosamine:LPS N-acetylglucosamine transferase
MMTKQTTTILFQPPNGTGLGHISRLMAIALAIRDKMPLWRLPFLVEGNSHSLLEDSSLPYILFPTNKAIYNTDDWAAWPIEERKVVLFKLADCIIRELRPDVILFDTFPCVPVMKAAARLEVPIALCIRKVKNMQKYFARMITYYQELKYLGLILVPHEPNEVEVPGYLAPKTRFVGRIVRPARETHMSTDFPANSKIVVITGGGGGYPNTAEFYNWALASFASSRIRNPDLVGVLITGPLFQDWRNLRVVDGVRVIPFDPNLSATLAAADLIICQAGYNTIAEVLHLVCPIICVPADRLWDNQYERAEWAAASNTNFHICRNLDADELSHLIDSCLQNLHKTRSGVDVFSMGATRAADALLELIANRSQSMCNNGLI